MNSHDYPTMSQSEWDNSPWSQEGPSPKEVEVTVSITLSKTVKIEVDDYTVEEEVDDEGKCYPNYDFSECNLESAVREQITLPNETEFQDWNEDDFEVVLE